ncbi:MAG: glycosyltransferase family 2 protein [Rhodobacter sp.]|nr:glycosyltransferase family 2 protein [Rhodobacter sp.]
MPDALQALEQGHKQTHKPMTEYSYCVVTCVKNEGPYLIEWLAHYRAIGVQRFLIFSNHSTDGTRELLDHLDRRGIVRHLPNPSLAFEPPPHRAALAYAPFHKELRGSDYAIALDVDEFLQIDLAERTLDGVMAHFGAPDILSVSELGFGFGGILDFEDRPVTEQFLLSTDLRPGKRRARRGVKSIMRVGPHIADYSNHRPVIAADYADKVRWLDGKGAQLGLDFVTGGDRGFDSRGCFDVVRLNHYTLRSGEAILAKIDRGDAVRNDRLGDFYFRKRDAARLLNTSFGPMLPGLLAEMDLLLADPETKSLHDSCVERYKARIAWLKPRMPDMWAAIQAQVAVSANRLAELKSAQIAA